MEKYIYEALITPHTLSVQVISKSFYQQIVWIKSITRNEIERAVIQLKNGKSTAIDDIPAEGLNNSSSVYHDT